MRFLLCFFSLGLATLTFAQTCDPASLDHEKSQATAGEYKGASLLDKLESLVKEISILSSTKYTDASEKNAMKHCLKAKDALFQILMHRPDPAIQEKASYHEAMADFYILHHDPRTALNYIDRAVEINPQSLPLLQKSFKLYSDVENIQLKDLSGKPLALPESQRVLLELSRRAGKVAEHPEASKELVIDALTHQAIAANLLKNYSDEMRYWDKILVIDPQNAIALQSRFTYFITKNMVTEAIEEMKRLIRENLVTPRNWTAFLEILFSNEKWDEYISWIKKAPADPFAKDPTAQTRLARAYLEVGRKEEAEKISKEFSKSLKGKSADLAAQNMSRLLEMDGDEFKAQSRLSEALDAYKKSLPASPHPLSVKEKISLLIYDYRKGLNFKPPEATQKDLEEVLQLLEKSVYQTELKSNLFAIYLHSLTLTQKQSELKKACARYKEVYPELAHGKDYTAYCTGQ